MRWGVFTYYSQASDIAQKKCTTLIKPLLEQLLNRAVYIIKRQTKGVQQMMDSRKQGKVRGNKYTSTSDIHTYDAYVKDCRKFVWFVQESYEEVVDDAADSILAKCKDEVRCTRMVCWAPGSIRE